MKTVHLVVAAPDFKSVVALRDASGWRVPRVDAANNVSRVNLASQLREKLDQIGPADLVHWAPLPWPDASFTDQYCAAVSHRPALARSDNNRRIAVVDPEELLTDSNLSAPEQLAVRTAMSRLQMPVAKFDSHTEFVEAVAWAERQFVQATGTRATTVTRYRGRRVDLVIRLKADADAAYLKAGVERVPDESALTERLRTLRLDQFPETLAVDLRHHRWLYRELKGTPLADGPFRPEAIFEAVRALASLQVATLDVPAIAASLAHRHRSAVQIFHAVDAVVEHAWRSTQPSPSAPLLEGWKTMSHAMIRTCGAIDALEVPCALVLSDLSMGNILVRPDGVGFIDLANAHWALPVLPLWRFVRDIEQRQWVRDPAARLSMRQAIVENFVNEWARIVPPPVMTQAIAHLWLVGRLFGILMASSGLDRYEQALGSELPAGFRATQLVGRVRDLLESFAERTLVPSGKPDTASALDLR